MIQLLPLLLVFFSHYAVPTINPSPPELLLPPLLTTIHSSISAEDTCNMLSYTHPLSPLASPITKISYFLPASPPAFLQNPCNKPFSAPVRYTLVEEAIGKNEKEEERIQKYRWVEIKLEDMTESQQKAMSKLPSKMTKRDTALMKQIICFDYSEGESRRVALVSILRSWVKIMKPKRADWLLVLKEMSKLELPVALLFEIAEFALLEDSFEANVRDYTKLIDGYGKHNRLQDAENTFQALKQRGFTCDQITFTVLIQMYSKAGNLNQAEEAFEELKLLGLPLDKRAYGAMMMAYIRAGFPERGEKLLKEMESQDIYAGKEVYKALLRAYSLIGDTLGAQRVFDAIQFARISPDVKLCALLLNAYRVAGESVGARSVFDNLRHAGLEPSDKCVALMLASYETENKLNVALDLLIDLEKDSIMVGKEASEVLVGWFRRLGVVDEVASVLREYATNKTTDC